MAPALALYVRAASPRRHLALYVRAGVAPPASLVGGVTKDAVHPTVGAPDARVGHGGDMNSTVSVRVGEHFGICARLPTPARLSARPPGIS